MPVVAMLYVEKDLSAIVKALFDKWPERKDELQWKYLHATNARLKPSEVCKAAEKGTCRQQSLLELESSADIGLIPVSGKKCEYVVLPSTGVKERDTMFALYNEIGMYPGVEIPDPEVLNLGVKLHGVEDYLRERVLPHLGLKAVA